MDIDSTLSYLQQKIEIAKSIQMYPSRILMSPDVYNYIEKYHYSPLFDSSCFFNTHSFKLYLFNIPVLIIPNETNILEISYEVPIL